MAKSRFRRKRKINKAALAAAITVALCLIAAVILGNYLGSKVDGAENRGIQMQASVPEDSAIVDMIYARKICAAYADINKLKNGEISAADITAAGCDAVSATAFKDGKIAFAGALSYALAGGENESEKIAGAIADMKAAGVYTCAVVFANSPYTSAPVDKIFGEYEAAAIKEIASLGFDEILFVFDALSKVNLEIICDYFERAKSCADEYGVAVSAGLPYSVISDANRAEIFSQLEKLTDTFALDCRGVNSKTLSDEIENSALYFTKYSLRVLLERDGENKYTEITDMLTEKSALCYQIISEAQPLE